ncbi:MAG: hypothetical protein ABIO44_06925 [Saprospiraceae bacterium]
MKNKVFLLLILMISLGIELKAQYAYDDEYASRSRSKDEFRRSDHEKVRDYHRESYRDDNEIRYENAILRARLQAMRDGVVTPRERHRLRLMEREYHQLYNRDLKDQRCRH